MGKLEIERDRVQISRAMTDQNGLVAVRGVDGIVRKMTSIDAKEHVASGVGTLVLPDGRSSAAGTAVMIGGDESRRAFGALPKQALRGICEEHHVAYNNGDSKEQLIESLVARAIQPPTTTTGSEV